MLMAAVMLKDGNQWIAILVAVHNNVNPDISAASILMPGTGALKFK